MATLLAASAADRARISDEITYHPNWPVPGVLFADVFPLLRSPALFELVLGILEGGLRAHFPTATVLVGLDARGFLFAPPLALRLGLRFAPARKAGKLPGPCATTSYALEYGAATLEMQRESVLAGDRAVLVDDLLATGGTLRAAAELVRACGAEVLGAVVVAEVPGLGGAAATGVPVHTLLQLRGE